MPLQIFASSDKHNLVGAPLKLARIMSPIRACSRPVVIKKEGGWPCSTKPWARGADEWKGPPPPHLPLLAAGHRRKKDPLFARPPPSLEGCAPPHLPTPWRSGGGKTPPSPYPSYCPPLEIPPTTTSFPPLCNRPTRGPKKTSPPHHPPPHHNNTRRCFAPRLLLPTSLSSLFPFAVLPSLAYLKKGCFIHLGISSSL